MAREQILRKCSGKGKGSRGVKYSTVAARQSDALSGFSDTRSLQVTVCQTNRPTLLLMLMLMLSGKRKMIQTMSSEATEIKAVHASSGYLAGQDNPEEDNPEATAFV